MENNNLENEKDTELDKKENAENNMSAEPEIISGTPEAKKAVSKKKVKKKKSKKRRIVETVLIILAIILLLVLIAAAIIITPLYMSYRKSYLGDKIPIETREAEYTIPDVPDDIIFDPSAETDDDYTEPDNTGENNNPSDYVPPKANDNYINPDSAEYNGINGIYTGIPIYYKERINKDVENILVIGTDSRNSSVDRGRSDVMIVVSYNKAAGTVKLVSFLRDSLVPVEGYGWTRLNHAYAYGGVGLCINTINAAYGLDIQNFVVIDFQGVEKLIDRAGGVTVNLSQAEADWLDFGLSAGNNLINGALALKHCRNRTIGSDFQRTSRQRDVIMALYNQIMSNKSATEIYDLVNYGITITRTNISTSTLMSMTSSVIKNPPSSFESLSLPFSDAYNGGYYNGMSILYFDLPSTASRLHGILYN